MKNVMSWLKGLLSARRRRVGHSIEEKPVARPNVDLSGQLGDDDEWWERRYAQLSITP